MNLAIQAGKNLRNMEFPSLSRRPWLKIFIKRSSVLVLSGLRQPLPSRLRHHRRVPTPALYLPLRLRYSRPY
jgi:hypothetical protein